MKINSPFTFITEHKIHHLYSLTTTHDDFDSVNPSSMQDACHIWTQLKWPCSPWVHVAQWIEHPPGGLAFDSCQGLRFFICPTLVLCWSVYFSHCIAELKIHHFYSFILFINFFAQYMYIRTCLELHPVLSGHKWGSKGVCLIQVSLLRQFGFSKTPHGNSLVSSLLTGQKERSIIEELTMSQCKQENESL